MITMLRRGFALALVLAVGSLAHAMDEASVVTRATALLEEISSNPESGIPPRFLHEAKGILIVPHMVDTRLGVGLKKGRGVLLTRLENGAWGDPESVTISGGSVGADAGRMVTDTVRIYRTREAVDHHVSHAILQLSYDISTSLRRPDRFRGPGPDSKTEESILTYTRKRGMVIGARIYGELMSKRSLPRVDPKAPPTAVQAAADTGTHMTATPTRPDGPVPVAHAKPARDSPEVARLKTVVSIVTNPPPAQVAKTRDKDPKVSPAIGTTAAAESAVSPR